MARATKLTAKKREPFTTRLAETGNVSDAARTINVSREALYDLRASDATFSTTWDDAISQYAERLEREADRRAVEGTTRTVYYQGIPVGEERQYSDTLLMFRLKALKPDTYRERVQQQVIGDPTAPVEVQITRRIVGGTV